MKHGKDVGKNLKLKTNCPSLYAVPQIHIISSGRIYAQVQVTNMPLKIYYIYIYMSKKNVIIKEYLKENIKQEELPVKLANKILENIFDNHTYEYRTKNNFLRCVGILYYKHVKELYGLEGFIPTGAAYWKTLFNRDYKEKVIQPLIDLNIIEFCDFGYQHFDYAAKKNVQGKEKGSVGIRYRINPELTDSTECIPVKYISNNNTPILTAEEVVANRGEDYLFEPIPDSNFFISIDKQRACDWVEKNAESICSEFHNVKIIGELPNDLVVKIHIYDDRGTFNSRYLSICAAKLTASLQQKQFFLFKEDFFIADAEHFLKHRERNLIPHYQRDIKRIGNIQLAYRRSSKTLRITNHLTNFPSKVLQFITINSQTLVQIDMRTSQFLLFANLLNVYIKKGEQELRGLFKKHQTKVFLARFIKVLNDFQYTLPGTGVDIHNSMTNVSSSSDVIRFIQDVFFKDFYSVVKDNLNLSSRGLAKLILFKLLFKRNNRSDVLINKLKDAYPVVMSIIAAFKQKNKEDQQDDIDPNKSDDINNFSVFLQCIESEIFIDRILKPLREKGVPCFSRHDSLCVADTFAGEVETFINDVFKDIGFRCNYKVEDKFWDIVDKDELENSPIMDWLADQDLLETDFSIEDSFEIDNDDDMESDEINYYIDDEKLETCRKLLEIGLQDDYFECVDVDTLEEITLLPLTMADKDIIYDEIVNQRDGLSFFQDKTNTLLSDLIERIEGFDCPEL